MKIKDVTGISFIEGFEKLQSGTLIDVQIEYDVITKRSEARAFVRANEETK